VIAVHIGIDDLHVSLCAGQKIRQLVASKWYEICLTFIGVDDLQVCHMPSDGEVVRARIPAINVQQDPRMHQCFAAVVPLHHRNHIGVPERLILEASKLEDSQETQCSLSRSVGEFLLHQLIRRQRLLELVSEAVSLVTIRRFYDEPTVEAHILWLERCNPPRHP
jgi:hypothetical protein